MRTFGQFHPDQLDIVAILPELVALRLGVDQNLLLKETFSQWTDARAPRLGTALAYFPVFSLVPLLVIIIVLIGLVLGPVETAIGRLYRRGLSHNSVRRIVRPTTTEDLCGSV